MKFKDKHPRMQAWLVSLALTGLFGVFSLPGHAAVTGPFDLDTTDWMSFDRYKENYKERLWNPEKAREEDERREKEKAQAEKNIAEKTPDAVPVIAEPERPLAPPIMPGMNKGYDVHVSSTADDIKPAKLTNLETQPDIKLPEQEWINAADAIQKNSETSGDKINIRMSLLPSLQAVASAGKEAKKVKPPAPKPLPVSATDLAACAALEAYRKKELEAIQIDRQTLTALQAAISQLGLQKELSFLTESNSKVSLPADEGVFTNPPASAPSLFSKP